MKTKEKKSLAHQSKEELVKEITALKGKITTIRLDRFTKQMKNSRETREMRKKIAVMETFIRQKELAV